MGFVMCFCRDIRRGKGFEELYEPRTPISPVFKFSFAMQPEAAEQMNVVAEQANDKIRKTCRETWVTIEGYLTEWGSNVETCVREHGGDATWSQDELI